MCGLFFLSFSKCYTSRMLRTVQVQIVAWVYSILYDLNYLILESQGICLGPLKQATCYR